MDDKTLRKLIQRLAVGRIAPGDEAEARRRLLADLHAAAIPTDHAASLSQEQLERTEGHTLLVWGRTAPGTVDLFVVPDSAIDDRMRTALDAINDLHYETPYDCSMFQYAMALRTLAATGLAAPDAETFYEREVVAVFDDMHGDRDLRELPSLEEITALYGSLTPYRVSTGDSGAAFDRRFTHAIAVRQKST